MRRTLKTSTGNVQPVSPMKDSACRGRPTRLKIDRRWPYLQATHPVFQYNVPHHLVTIEPLSVHAFTSIVASSTRNSSVLDVGSNVGAYTVIAALLGAHVIAVDMQPMCVWMTACNLRANKVHADVKLGYVAPSHVSHSIRVPDDECSVMASPTAVAGRYPHGLMQKKSRIIYGIDNRTSFLSQTMQMLHVPPIDIGAYISKKHATSVISVAKIDTEGFEMVVLESLRPVWHMLMNVILELQPRSWHYSNVTLAQGVRTLYEISTSQGFTVVTMPHAERQTDASAIAEWRACDVPLVTTGRPFAPGKDIVSSRRFGVVGIEHFVNSVYSHPNIYGWFVEILLTKC